MEEQVEKVNSKGEPVTDTTLVIQNGFLGPISEFMKKKQEEDNGSGKMVK